MPKETFFRLPEEKKQRLLKAAEVEFSNNKLKDASINRIIKLAEIPRGSFYQYFEDLEDLYFYYFSLLHQNEAKKLDEAFTAGQGDFFKAIELYFDSFLAMILNGHHQDFYRQLFTGMDFPASDKVMPFKGAYKHREMTESFQKRIVQKIDLTALKVTSEEEFMVLFKLVMATFFSSIYEAFKIDDNGEKLSPTEIKKRFYLKMEWLKNGALKKTPKGETEC